MNIEFGDETIRIPVIPRERRVLLEEEEIRLAVESAEVSPQPGDLVIYEKILIEFATNPKYGRAQELACQALTRLSRKN